MWVVNLKTDLRRYYFLPKEGAKSLKWEREESNRLDYTFPTLIESKEKADLSNGSEGRRRRRRGNEKSGGDGGGKELVLF